MQRELLLLVSHLRDEQLHLLVLNAREFVGVEASSAVAAEVYSPRTRRFGGQ